MSRTGSKNPQIQEWSLNMDAEIAARQQLDEIGITKVEDLTSGRADIGRAAEVFINADVDEELSPLMGEKAIRDAEFARLAGAEEQPIATQSAQAAAPNDRLSQMQEQLAAAQAEAERFKALYGKGENEKGNLRRRVREIEERIEGRNNAPQYHAPQGYNPAMLGIVDPASPVTAAEMQQALASFAVAMGNVVQQSREEVIQQARNLNKYDLSVDEEENLLDDNPWLRSLPSGQREQAMFKLARSGGSTQPTTPAISNKLTPRPTAPEDALRVRARQAAFIEAPSGASTQERSASSAIDMAQTAKLQKLKEALSRPGGSKDAEEILKSLGAGPVDDRDRGFSRG